MVDNGSSDRSSEVACRWGAVVVHEPRVGIPAAATAGYDAARGDVIARLDADSRPGPRWVETVVAHMAEDPGLASITGAGAFHDLPRGAGGVASVGYLGAYYVLGHLALGHPPLWGSCMALRATAWREVLTTSAHGARDPDAPGQLDRAAAVEPVGRAPGPVTGLVHRRWSTVTR